jgi:hypothetical protein
MKKKKFKFLFYLKYFKIFLKDYKNFTFSKEKYAANFSYFFIAHLKKIF